MRGSEANGEYAFQVRLLEFDQSLFCSPLDRQMSFLFRRAKRHLFMSRFVSRGYVSPSLVQRDVKFRVAFLLGCSPHSLCRQGDFQ